MFSTRSCGVLITFVWSSRHARVEYSTRSCGDKCFCPIFSDLYYVFIIKWVINTFFLCCFHFNNADLCKNPYAVKEKKQ